MLYALHHAPEDVASIFPHCTLGVHLDKFPVRVLLDTGCLGGNFVSSELGDWAASVTSVIRTPNCISLCSPVGSSCACINEFFTAILVFNVFDLLSNLKMCEVEISTDFKVIRSDRKRKMHFDVIIGLQTIIDNDLLRLCAHRFSPQRSPLLTTNPGVELASIFLNAMATSALKDFEGDEVEPPVDDTPVWTSPRTPLSLVGELPTDIQGSDSFQSAVRQLLDEFRDVFSKTLSEEPARVTPLRLEVDHTRWHSSAARLPPRLQGAVKGKEILLQTSQMLELGLIRPSQEAYHSQVHLVRKPNDKWRFTIDFRLLNDATTKMSWPLPNIGEMLERIGSTRPTIFSKFDLTSGYHQFPLEEASRRYTAFVTPFGTYEYTRVPMGITPAGSYFQQTMAVEVLAELLHQGREIYLDDLLQYDNSEEVHLIRLRETFTRARVKNLKFHPEKMVIGASAIGFVGHLIDTTGIRFSDEKLDGIRDFALPKTKRDLKSFLGLANYFRDHVSHHSDLAARLQGMIGNYEQKQRSAHLLWTPDLLACYSNLQEAIIQCQKLFYLDDSLPIHLATDASDYALGAYLYQVRPDGTEIPIRFVSKSFTGEQLRWNVPEKECYAIVFTLKKLEHLLRDIFFVLHTDHENLTRCYSSGSPKVYRWKLLIQGFNMAGHRPHQRSGQHRGRLFLPAGNYSPICRGGSLEHALARRAIVGYS
jgi:hypothetical protein